MHRANRGAANTSLHVMLQWKYGAASLVNNVKIFINIFFMLNKIDFSGKDY